MMIVHVLTIVLLWLLLCGCHESQTAQIPASESGVKIAEVPSIELVDLSLPPVSTFEASCANCHGPQGSFFGDEFAHLADAQLGTAVKDMMEGPAFLKPSDADLLAMVAYHRALAAKEPFICVTAFHPPAKEQPGWLKGQATPGAEVSVMGGEVASVVASETGAWQLRGIGSSLPLILTARKSAKMTTLDLHQSQWSHAAR